MPQRAGSAGKSATTERGPPTKVGEAQYWRSQLEQETKFPAPPPHETTCAVERFTKRYSPVTKLTGEQFEIVIREIHAMLDDGDLDEAWRVMKMFADGRFNFRVDQFPSLLPRCFAELGRDRRKDYGGLLDQIRSLCGAGGPPATSGTEGTASGPLALQTIGEVRHAGRTYPLVKLVTMPPASPYATRLPICIVAGVHGDEPDGVLSALEFARRFARSPNLTDNYSLTIYPCINPTGYQRMTRENLNGKDLNREFFRDSA